MLSHLDIHAGYFIVYIILAGQAVDSLEFDGPVTL